MFEFDLVLQLSFHLDVVHLVQVAVDNAAAIRDLTATVYIAIKVSKELRKTSNKQ